MPLQITLERTIGPYNLKITGKREELQEILETLDAAAVEISETKELTTQTPQQTSLHAEVPSVSRSKRLSEAIIELFRAEWGESPRGIGEVRDALATNGLIYPLTTLSGTLLNLTKRGILRRIRTQEGYRYVRGPS